MESIDLRLSPDEKVTLTTRTLVEVNLSHLELSEQEEEWLWGEIQIEIEYPSKHTKPFKRATFQHTSGGEVIFWLPDDEESFIEEFKDAPERLKKIFQDIFKIHSENQSNDFGYVLIVLE